MKFYEFEFLKFRFKEHTWRLRDLIPFVKFKKPEKYPSKSVILVKLQNSACNFTKSNTHPSVFFTKSHKVSYIFQKRFTFCWEKKKRFSSYRAKTAMFGEINLRVLGPKILKSLPEDAKHLTLTAWKVSVFLVSLVCIFPHSDWIQRFNPYLRIQSEWRKIRTRKTPDTDTFHAVSSSKIYRIHSNMVRT